MTLFERVKEISKKRGFSSLRILAEQANLSQNVIYGWKTNNPSASALKAVADVLNVSVDYLLGNTENPSSNTPTTKVDLVHVAKNDEWDEWMSADGAPLTDHDKAILKAMFDL
ncbi:MAG: helix-turn-helix domain-containing protein [Lactobacillaceae bacterium]|nr:helix-turn-helix domain-containing protein [Lactobacillaceae bacterium]